MDSNKTIGIISLKGISNGNYTITQKASNNNYLDSLFCLPFLLVLFELVITKKLAFENH